MRTVVILLAPLTPRRPTLRERFADFRWKYGSHIDLAGAVCGSFALGGLIASGCFACDASWWLTIRALFLLAFTALQVVALVRKFSA